MNQNNNGNKRQISNSILFYLTLFSVTFFVYNDLNISKNWGYIIFVSIVFLNCLCTTRCIYISRIKLALLCLVITIVFFYCLDSRKDREMITYALTMLICLAIFFIAQPNLKNVDYSIRAIIIFALIFFVYIAGVTIFPDLYWKNIYPFLPEGVREYAQQLINDGYGIPIGGSIIFADYVMAMAIVSMVSSLIVKLQNRPLKILKYITIVLLLFCGIMLEGRRSELLCILSTVCVMFVLSIDFRLGKETRKKFSLVGLVGILSLFVILLLGTQGYLDRFVRTVEQIVLSVTSGAKVDITSGRIRRWRRAWELFQEAPFMGIGWGRYANYAFGDFREIAATTPINDKYVHNDYLNILCETGIIGFLGIIVPLLYIFITTYRQNRRLQRYRCHQNILILNFISLGIQMFFGFLSFLDPSFYKFYFWFFYTVAVILLDFTLKEERKLKAVIQYQKEQDKQKI